MSKQQQLELLSAPEPRLFLWQWHGRYVVRYTQGWPKANEKAYRSVVVVAGACKAKTEAEARARFLVAYPGVKEKSLLCLGAVGASKRKGKR